MSNRHPCPSCGNRLTTSRWSAHCYVCGWHAEPNPYREDENDA